MNPLDAITGFVLKFIFSVLIGFIGIFISTLVLGNVGQLLISTITSTTFAAFTITQTETLLSAALSFFLDWMPHIWYMFQWVLWILTAGQLFPYPEPVW